MVFHHHYLFILSGAVCCIHPQYTSTSKITFMCHYVLFSMYLMPWWNESLSAEGKQIYNGSKNRRDVSVEGLWFLLSFYCFSLSFPKKMWRQCKCKLNNSSEDIVEKKNCEGTRKHLYYGRKNANMSSMLATCVVITQRPPVWGFTWHSN